MDPLELVIGSAVAISGVAAVTLSLYDRLRLQRKHFALDMIRNWNAQTADSNETIRLAYRDLYERCKVHGHEEQLRRLVHAADEGFDAPEKSAIVRLLNYFEFVSASYLSGAADRSRVHESVTGTMVRYYCVLSPFIDEEIKYTGRNPWLPYSRFVYSVIDKDLAAVAGLECLRRRDDGSFECACGNTLPVNARLGHTYAESVCPTGRLIKVCA